MNKIFYPIFLISFFLFSGTILGQDEDCNIFELIPPLEQGQLSDDTPPVPCGFTAADGSYVNECSPCGSKISDNDCVDAPNPTLCELDGFTTTTAGFTNDVPTITNGFCGPGTGTHNNFWIGFTAQTTSIELIVTTFNCVPNPPNQGVQIAICETNCIDQYRTMSGANPCFGGVGQGGLFNNSTPIDANNLVPGNPYFILVDGFAGGVCDLRIDVVGGFDVPEYDTAVNDPGQLCPDVLNPGGYTSAFGSGAIVDVMVGGIATTDLTYYWLDPAGNVIETTVGTVITPNFVRGELDGSYFDQVGTYSVQIIDNGSCCPLCTTVALEVADPPPAAAAIISGVNGGDELNCNNDMVLLEGNPDNGIIPAAESWTIVDAAGDRQQLAVSFVANTGRINEFTVTRDIIDDHFPGQEFGEAVLLYGFVENFDQLCFGDAFVTVPFDFRKPDIDIDTPADIDCASNPSVELNASNTDTYGHNATYEWKYEDGTTAGISSGGDTDRPTVGLSGFYTLVVTDLENGCVDSLPVQVGGMVDPPTLTAIPDTVLNCYNSMTVEVMSMGDAGGDPITYSWSGPNGNIPVASPMLSVTEAGEYFLTAVNTVNGCQGVTSFMVMEDTPTLTVDALGDSTRTCATTSITFPTPVINGGAGEYTYSWLDENDMELTTMAELTASLAGTYTLVVTDEQSGCIVEQTASITADENLPQIEALPTDLVLNCTNSMMVSTSANVTDSNGDPIPNLEYEWLDEDMNPLGVNTAGIDITAEGTYTVLVNNPANGCASSAPVTITMDLDEPNISIETPDALTCAAGTITLTGGSTADVSYQWYSGMDDSGTALDATNTQQVSTEGAYTLVVTDNINGCTSIMSTMVTTNAVNPVPAIAAPATLNCNNLLAGIELDASGSTGGTLTFAWTGPMSAITDTDPLISVTEAGMYTLVVTDSDNGCTEMTSVMVMGDFAEPENVMASGGIITCDAPNGIMLSGSSTSPNVSYMWRDQGMVVYPGQNPTVTSAGEYILTVTNLDNGCTATATATVSNDSNVPTVLWEQLSGETADISCKNPERTFRGFLQNPDPNVTLTWFDPIGEALTGNPITLDEFSLEGTYTIEGFNATNNCEGSSTVSVSFDFSVPEIVLDGGTIFCDPNDAVTLSADVTDPSDPNANATFTWTGPDAVSLTPGLSNPTVTMGGTWTVIATSDASGCTSMGMVQVAENNEPPIVSAAPNFDFSCRPGENSYNLMGTASAANGMDNLTYSWILNNTEVSTDPNYTVTEEGTYVLTVTNTVSNCTETTMVEIGDTRTTPQAVANVQETLNCETPMVLLEGDATDPMATYLWTSPTGAELTDQSPMVSEAGEWELVITSPENGCTGFTTVEVMDDFALPENVEINGPNVLTCGSNFVQLSGSTSTMDIQGFEWTVDNDNTFINTETAPSVSEPGIYTLTVIGANGCEASTTFEVTQDEDLPVVGASVESILTCDNGSTMITGTSSAANSTFEWTGPPGFLPVDGVEQIEATIAGDYTVTITDEDNGCSSVATATVDLNITSPDISTVGTTVTCEDIIFSISASSMTDNVTYLWEGPNNFESMDTNPVVTNAGTYSVTITDPANGCISEEDVEVIEGGDFPENLVTEADVMVLTCDDTESILTASSSTTGLEYTWTGDNINPTMGETITVTQPGNYTVNYFNPTNGCGTTELISIELDDTAPMISPATPEILNCQRTEVPLEVTSVEAIRTYEWEGPIAGSLSALDIASPMASEPGMYSVTVTSVDNGCTSVASILVMEDTNIPVSAPMASELSCEFMEIDLDGSASSSGPDITYEWTNESGLVISTDPNTTTTQPGDYTLTVFNSSNECAITETITVGQDILAPTADAGMAVDFPCAASVVTLSGSGTGQGSLSYMWLNESGAEVGDQASIEVAQSGEFTLVVTDSDNGCTAASSVDVIPDENKPVIDLPAAETLTCAVTSVTLDASGTTGQGNLNFTWTFETNGTPAGNGSTINATSPGIYTVLVVDESNGCDESRSIEVMQNIIEPTFTVEGGEIDCNSGPTSVTVNGLSITNASYLWTGPGGFSSTDATLTNITDPGLYSVVITDEDNGCFAEGSDMVSSSMDIPISTFAPAGILDCDTEEIQLVADADAGLSYSWSGPNILSGGNTLTPLVGQAGTYTLLLTDPDNGCTGTNSIDVEENTDVITAIIPDGDDVNCFGPNTGSISINQNQVTGGAAPYVYSIDGGESFTTQEEFLGLVAGMYDVVVMDANGCLYDESITINPAEELILDLGENQIIAYGDSIMLDPDKNFDIAIAEWNDTTLVGGTPWVAPLNTTSYELVAFDEDGCLTTDNITIFVEKTRPVYIPSAFSPNKDGTNDFFTVFADLGLISEIKSFSVYDRWGAKLHDIEGITPAQALEAENSWDGKHRGDDMNPGVYVYHILVEFIDGEEIFYEGNVTLFR